MWSCWVDTLGLTAAPSPRLAALLPRSHTHTLAHASHLLLPLSRCALRHGVFSSLPVLLYLTLIHANIAFSSAAFFNLCTLPDFGYCGLLWILCLKCVFFIFSFILKIKLRNYECFIFSVFYHLFGFRYFLFFSNDHLDFKLNKKLIGKYFLFY